MDVVKQLIDLDKITKKTIAVVGESMEDVWIHGKMVPCQDGVLKHVESYRVHTPGGAAGAARQFCCRWQASGQLIGPWCHPRVYGREEGDFTAFGDVDVELALEECVERMPQKNRYLDEYGSIVARADREMALYGVSNQDMAEARNLALLVLRNNKMDAILVSDYAKGFLDVELVQSIVSIAQRQGIPCVIDPRRAYPGIKGAVVKTNHEMAIKDRVIIGVTGVITDGAGPPCVVEGLLAPVFVQANRRPVKVVNHVGAGDCFAAIFTLALAHGLSLHDAAEVAHAAGRVYVQHGQGRPPFPHEIRKDRWPLAGKILDESDVSQLRASIHQKARVVVANGVFRIPHAGHAEMLAWAKQTGDVLVVAINDAASAFRHKPGQYVQPLEERLMALAAQDAVDWVVPFSADTPEEIIKRLAPCTIVKGEDYRGSPREVPGASWAKAILFAPPGACQRHCTQLIADIKES